MPRAPVQPPPGAHGYTSRDRTHTALSSRAADRAGFAKTGSDVRAKCQSGTSSGSRHVVHRHPLAVPSALPQLASPGMAFSHTPTTEAQRLLKQRAFLLAARGPVAQAVLDSPFDDGLVQVFRQNVQVPVSLQVHSRTAASGKNVTEGFVPGFPMIQLMAPQRLPERLGPAPEPNRFPQARDWVHSFLATSRSPSGTNHALRTQSCRCGLPDCLDLTLCAGRNGLSQQR